MFGISKITIMRSLLIYLTAVVSLSTQENSQIRIGQGRLKGRFRYTWKGRRIIAFTGIPFAEPPVGNLRFEPPVPAKSWNGTLDATKPHAICPQINVFLRDYTPRGTEDCLYLDVYTPELPNTKNPKLPVMYFIYGGGWMNGDANTATYGPDILLDKDVVLVAANYRVGPLGFLSTGDQVVPGNNGFKDQALALRWIKQNIANFGGDPDKVTVFGQSAGSSSSHYFMVSPLTRGLIHGVISESGTAVGVWSMSQNDTTIKNGKKLGRLLNCPTNSSKEMIDCLRKVPAYDIVRQDPKFFVWMYDPLTPFKPVVEGNHEGAFLTEDPIETIKSGKAAPVPFMTGFTTQDGAIKAAAIYNNYTLVEQFNDYFMKLAPISLGYEITSPDKNYVSKTLRKFYFDDKQINNSTKSEVTDLFTDGWILSGEDIAVHLHTKYTKHPVYYYVFGYRGSVSYSTLFGDPTHNYGVCHEDDLIYLLSTTAFPYYRPTKHDLNMNDVMTTLWTNFAATGNPTPTNESLIGTIWEPTGTDNINYFVIKNGSYIRNEKNLYSERINLWRTLPIDPARQALIWGD